MRTPVDIHELYKWYMLNWSITISHVSRFPNQNIKSPMMWRRVANHKTSMVLLVGASHRIQYTLKTTSFGPPQAQKKWGYFDPKYGGLLEKNSPPRMVGGSGGQTDPPVQTLRTDLDLQLGIPYGCDSRVCTSF